MRFLCIAILILYWRPGLMAQPSIPPIGMWREHLPYNSAIDVTAGENKVYCSTPYSIFVVDRSSNSIERLSRISGLSETGISTIRYDEANGKLFIAYANSNIDIIHRNDVKNIPDIKRDNIIGDKTIYNISPLGKNYYLSTGIGIIVIDGERYEVKDSWLIGNGGSQVKVNGFASDGGFYYAATQEGLKKASVNSPNLANYNNWQLVSGTNGLAEGPCRNIFTVGGKLLLHKDDTLFVQEGSDWQLFYTDGWPIISSNTSEGKVQLCQRMNIAGRVTILNATGSVYRILEQTAPVSFPRKAIVFNNDPWVADQFGGLSHHTTTGFEQFKPNSPEATASGELTVYNNVFYATAGEVNDAWNYQYNGDGIFKLEKGQWTNINRYVYSQIDSLLDFISIVIDPRDETAWVGSYGGGLLHLKPGPVFDIYKQGTIEPAIGDPASYRVSGLAFDSQNNLWVSNYGSQQPLKIMKSDGSWKNISIPFSLDENALAQLVIDDNDYKWVISPKGNGLVCYDHGASIDNTGDDRWKLFRGGQGNGNLPTNEALCVAKDKNGFIWVGTTDGIGVIQCPGEVFTALGCEAVLPVVQQGGFSSFLFKGEEVLNIAVDGADRKWVATKNGVSLINAEGTRVIYHFTEDNSPLLGSEVKKIAIDGQTGEVYFATLKGICSFRSTATEGNETNQDVLVFPNPVPPGYSGSIGIRGLVNNATVKIVELNGRLIYQARALGGQMVWDGRDYKGRKISTGIYLVLVSNDGKTEKSAAKIIFIGK